SVFLWGQSDFVPDSIRWEPSGFVRTDNALTTYAFPEETTVFQLTLTDTSGCRVTGRVEVIVDQRVPIYVPNAFSPNTDGANDLFQVYGNRGVERVNIFRIFNRWGEMVFEQLDFDPENPNIGWDGTHRGELLNPAVFVYYVSATLSDGREIELKGDLLLRR
ncbi:MAG: gliding motility-associated C-terminal domain-containing protein, partial [Bacteroidota bacterium]